MKNVLLTFLGFFAHSLIAQPEYPEPCSNYTIDSPYWDLNNDGKADLMLQMSSEGTDDVPSSSGVCFYAIQFINADMGFLVPEDWNFHSGISERQHKDTAKYIASNYSRVNQLLFTPYGNSANGEWMTVLDSSEYYTFYFIDGNDTTLGWFELKIDAPNGKVEFGSSALFFDSDYVEPGSYQEIKSIIKLGWTHDPQVGLMLVDQSPLSTRTMKGGIYAGYFAQYGILIGDYLLLGFETSLNAEFYNWNASNNLNLRWSSNIHIVFLDFGVGLVEQNPLSSNLSSSIAFQWEAGVSLANYRLMMVFNARSLDNGAAENAFPRYGLRMNYQF